MIGTTIVVSVVLFILAIYGFAQMIRLEDNDERLYPTLALITAFVFGLALVNLLNIKLAMEYTASYNEEWEIKCRTIKGEFSQKLNGCYKDGIKINFEEE